MDAAFAEHNTDRARTASAFLFGGTTYRGAALTYWPQQYDNPDASPLDHYIAKRYAEGIPITAVSDTLTADDRGAQLRVGRVAAMSTRTMFRPA